MHDWLAIFAIAFLVAIPLSGWLDEEQGERFNKTEVRGLIEQAADCHAEFFYAHDPQITGVGIREALTACDPWGK